MSGAEATVFAQWAPIYRERGFWPRPVDAGSKRCSIKGWQQPDPEIAEAERVRWATAYGRPGIGLLMGSPFPDGTRLGAIDIDRDEYVRVGAALLGTPPSGRFGSKGAVFFVRVAGHLGNPKFKVAGAAADRWGTTAECLFDKTFCVIPPTIHPSTGSSYRWLGTPLHEVDFNDLPLIGE